MSAIQLRALKMRRNATALRRTTELLLRRNRNCRRALTTTASNSCTPVRESNIAKAYDPIKFEETWNTKWLERKSKDRESAPTFRMILPPPNVTGKLHLGHALTIAIEDTIARWKNMNGYRIEWIPGFDHAGIATHAVAARKLGQSALTGDPLKFREQIEGIAQDNQQQIREQLKTLGAILNWESEYYTLDANHSNVVKEAFLQLYEAGLIQRSDGIVNWSCALQSSVSDVEVEHVDFKARLTLRVPNHEKPIEFGVLYHCAYKLQNSDDSIVVATSRPETMYGDVALAVNPSDTRNAKYIGRTVINPVNGQILPIIGDSRVKTDFGSGVVKITPAHDKLDFAIGTTHNLPKVNILTPQGYLNELAGDLKGSPRLSARQIVLELLDKKGALQRTQEYGGVVHMCSRSGDVIEPKVLPHWFLKTRKLTDSFIDAVKSESFIISPENYATGLINSLSDCQDWCLSRQINWGHPIPMYHHMKHPEQWVSAIDVKSAKKKLEDLHKAEITNLSEIVQDKDVLDTWFSSSLIPVASSGWPDLKDLKPISLMETGHDILMFWVWRMVIVTAALTNQYPFQHVFLHGIVSDKYGRKMSKSKGNVIDPLHVINGLSASGLKAEATNSLKSGDLDQNEYELRISAVDSEYPEGFQAFGRDALRMVLLSQNVKSQEISLDMLYLENCRHFTNKIWQAQKFFLMHKKDKEKKPVIASPLSILSITSVADLWLLNCLLEFATDVEKHLDSGQFHLYIEAVRKFFYQQLCDVYIEMIKMDLKTGVHADQHLLVMEYAFLTGLKLSHPVIPYVTEELWSNLSNEEGLLIDQPFPKPEELQKFRNPQLNRMVLKSVKLIKEIRSIKTRTGIKPRVKPMLFLEAHEISDLKEMKGQIDNLGGCQLIFDSPPPLEKSSFITVIIQLDGKICKISLPKGDGTTKYIESERNKILKLQTKLAKLKQQYENANFQNYASPEVKEKLRQRLETLETQINEVLATTPNPEDTRI